MKNIPRIALNMIVKNEAHIILETLNSVCKYVQYWVIVDTGSTDGTQQIIIDFFQQKNIKGELIQGTWNNDFSDARNRALNACKNKSQYIFIIDADDVLHGDFVIPPDNEIDAFLIQYGNDYAYLRKQIFKNTGEWSYTGLIHEFIISSNPSPKVATITGNYYIDSRRLGNRSKDTLKYYKDALICQKGKIIDPKNLLHYYFYAGQSYMDFNYYKKALVEYKSLVHFQLNLEYKCLIYNRIGLCLEKLNASEAEIKDAYISAYKSMPTRAESLYNLGNYYNKLQQYTKALPNFIVASKIAVPTDFTTIINKEIYVWKIKFKLAYTYFKLKQYNDALNICKSINYKSSDLDEFKTTLETLIEITKEDNAAEKSESAESVNIISEIDTNKPSEIDTNKPSEIDTDKPSIIDYEPKPEPEQDNSSYINSLSEETPSLYCITNDIKITTSEGSPKKIMQTYHSRYVVKELYDKVEIIKKLNPTYEYVFFDDNDCISYLGKHFDNNVVEAFKSIKAGAFKADLFRYCFLYREGGIYLDIKGKVLKSFDSILSDCGQTDENFIIANERKPYSDHGYCYNGFIIAKPNSDILKQCINICVYNITNKLYCQNALAITGPAIFSTIKEAQDKNKNFCEYHIDGYSIIISQTKEMIIDFKSPEYRKTQTKDNYYMYMWKNKTLY